MFFEEMANHAANKAIRDLEASGRVGRSEKPVYTFNGNAEGKETTDNLVKISNDTPDLSTAEKIIIRTYDTGEAVEVTKDMLSIAHAGAAEYAELGGTILVMVVKDADNASNGIYVQCNEFAYASRIEFAETIHPISDKYLPGVCLPVVELTTKPTADGVPLNDAEMKQVDAALRLGDYCLVSANGGLSNFIARRVLGTNCYAAQVPAYYSIEGTTTSGTLWRNIVFGEEEGTYVVISSPIS